MWDPTRSRYVLSLRPEAATSPSATHSTLVTSQTTYTSPTFTVPIRTVQQLRTGSAPNDWEVAWVLFDYTPDDSFYSVILKPDGWELDKETKGVESFIAEGTRAFQIGRWYDVTVSQQGSSITVSVNGTQIVSATDSSYTSGSIGLYCEDSIAHYGNVVLSQP